MNPDEIGDKYEVLVFNELIKYNSNATANKVKRGSGEYDESIGWYDFLDFGGIEVKGDEIADNSNKYAFDKFTNGEPSGLSTTKAKWHVLFTLTRYFIINTDIIKWLCEYKGEFRYWHGEADRFINVAVLRDEKFYNKNSGNIMDLYRIPIPAILMFSIDSGNIEDFNLKSLL